MLVHVLIHHIATTGTLFTVQKNLNLFQTFLLSLVFQAKLHEFTVNCIDINLISIMRTITKGKQ